MSNITISRLAPVTVDLTEKGRQALQAAALEAEIAAYYRRHELLMQQYHAAHESLLEVTARLDFTETGKAEWAMAMQAVQDAHARVWALENAPGEGGE